MTQPLLELKHISIAAGRNLGTRLVDNVTLAVAPGECLGLVGESGSGKSLTIRSVLGLFPDGVGQVSGSIAFDGASIEPASLRGAGVAMVFQEPMRALNPTKRIGELVAIGARQRGESAKQARDTALRLLGEVGIPEPESRMRAWPHELSGGQRQRVMIAMALSVEPRVLLCDEPTTALDVTVQRQILRLLAKLRAERGLSMIFVSHDLAVISNIADRTAVMYAGSIVELAPTNELIAKPQHPYTKALVASMPTHLMMQRRLPTIPGVPPAAGHWPAGCRFAPRCEFATLACSAEVPPLIELDRDRCVACIHALEVNP